MEEEVNKDDSRIHELTDKTKTYLNANSKRVFVIMIAVLVLSIAGYAYRFATREKAVTPTLEILDEVKQSTDKSFDTNNLGLDRLSKYWEAEKELDRLLEKDRLSSADSTRILELYNEIKAMEK